MQQFSCDGHDNNGLHQKQLDAVTIVNALCEQAWNLNVCEIMQRLTRRMDHSVRSMLRYGENRYV